MSDTFAPPTPLIQASVTTVGAVLEGLALDSDEVATLLMLDADLRSDPQSGPSFLTVAVLAWLQARRTTHPGISWEDAEPLIRLALT